MIIDTPANRFDKVSLAAKLSANPTIPAEATHAVIHALNEWMHETWSFDYEGRIFATPLGHVWEFVDQLQKDLRETTRATSLAQLR